MSATMQPAIGPTNGTRRGRPNTGAKRTRRTKAQIAAAREAGAPIAPHATEAAKRLAIPDAATEFAARVAADLATQEIWVRDKAAVLLRSFCSALLKAA